MQARAISITTATDTRQTPRHTTAIVSVLAVALFLASGAPPAAWAVPGDLDLTFGTGGIVRMNFGDDAAEALDLVSQCDGKVVVVGHNFDDSAEAEELALARYRSDGTLDPDFGVGGKVTTPIGTPSQGAAYGVALQSNQYIVVAGYAYDNGFKFALARYDTAGVLDPSFNGGGAPPGIVTTTLTGTSAGAYAIAIQPDQRIVVAGYTFIDGLQHFALARYEATGALDGSFGNGGIVITPIGPGHSKAYAIAIDPVDHAIVAGGYADTGTSIAFAVARYGTYGTLDALFNPSGTPAGTAVTAIGSYQDSIADLAIQPLDQKIVAVGGNTDGRFIVARYLRGGALDATFDESPPLAPAGVVVTAFDVADDVASGVALQPDGKIVVAGFGERPVESRFEVARYLDSGALDTSFGPGGTGTVTTDLGYGALGYKVALQPSGNIVVAGTAEDDPEFVVVRYEGEADNPCGGTTPTATATPAVTATVTPTTTATVTPIMTATETPTPAVTPTPAPPLDHFTCYKATATGLVKFPGISKPPGISVVDHFGSTIVAVRKTNRSFCAPTDKLGEDPTAKFHPEHLTGYPLANGTKPPFPTHIRVVDQFNASGLFVDAKRRSHLLVPTVKSLTMTPPLPGTFTTDHFQCYTARVTKGTPPFAAVPGVTLEDQFGTMTVTVLKPKYFCLPVNKNGEDGTAPSHVEHLMCYGVKQTVGVPFKKGIFVNNQFGPQTLTVKKPDVLCVPALRDP